MFSLRSSCRRVVAPIAAQQLRLCSSAVPAGMTKMESPDSAAKIDEFAKLYTQLTLKEITQLQRTIFKQLGHSEDFYEQALLRGLGGGGGGGGGGAAVAQVAAAAAPAAEAAEEAPKKVASKSAYDVNLKAYPADIKIKLIKELRGVTQQPLKEAKSMIDNAPGLIAKNMAKDDAEKLRTIMMGLGAEIELQ